MLGGAAAGLSAAACLQHEGLSAVVIEKNEASGDIWRSRYHRLHLHDIIDAIDGVSHVTQVMHVNERHSVFISPNDPVFSGVWQQLLRLRAAGGHAGSITVSA